jgi:hypothetical protein
MLVFVALPAKRSRRFSSSIHIQRVHFRGSAVHRNRTARIGTEEDSESILFL